MQGKRQSLQGETGSFKHKHLQCFRRLIDLHSVIESLDGRYHCPSCSAGLRSTLLLLLQVVGCSVNLQQLNKLYNLKKGLCPEHLKVRHMHAQQQNRVQA
jgi:hypothetical protein